MRTLNKPNTISNRSTLNGSLNKPDGFLNMLQLRKPRHASLFLLLMAKESGKTLLLMLSRKEVKECGKKGIENTKRITIRKQKQARNTPENVKYCRQAIKKISEQCTEASKSII